MDLGRERRKSKPSPHEILITMDAFDKITGKRVVRFAPRKLMCHVRGHKTKSKKRGMTDGTQR